MGQSSKENGPAKYNSAYDIVGPIMVGPSSSHTAGAVRIGNIAYQLLNEKPKTVTFTLMGSFAKTYQGHGTDLALLAGVLGLTTMDDQIPEAKAVAKQNGLSYSFTTRVLGSYHPNTVLIELAGESRKVKLIASSIGGGKVEVQELDNYPLKFSGEQPTLVLRHQDSRGVIAELSSFLYEKGFNIARLLNERSSIGGSAITICEVDYLVDDSLLTELKAALPIIDELLLIKTD
nr:L-serine ammonia-lyase, iron-sulfur-dependent subunit beta [Amphibacillus xylanus]